MLIASIIINVVVMCVLLYLFLSLGQTNHNLDTLQKNTQRKYDYHQKLAVSIADWLGKMDTTHDKIGDDNILLFKIVDYFDVHHLDNCAENRGGKCSCGKRQARINFLERLKKVKNGRV